MPNHATAPSTHGKYNHRKTNRSRLSSRAVMETLEFRRLFALPAGWSDVNIYNAAFGGTANGSANYSNGVFTVAGSGFGYDLGFHYAYTTYTGDFDAIMRLTNLTNATGERSSVSMMVRSGNGFFDASAYNAGWQYNEGESFPQWYRMVRVGDVVTGYSSDDGQFWTPEGNEHLFNLPSTVEVGIAVTSPSSTGTITATVDNFQIRPLDLEYQSAWVANSYGDVDGFIQYNFDALTLGPNGVVFANTNWEEGGSALGIYGDVGTNQGGKLGLLQGAISGGYAVAYDTSTNWAYFVRGDWGTICGVRVTSAGVFDPFGGNTNSNNWANTYFGSPHGMAVRNGELYIADTSNNQIIVYNLSTKTRVRTWSAQSPGPIAIDNRGNVWVIRIDGNNPGGTAVYGTGQNEGNYIDCYSSTGTLYSSKTISMAGMRPSGIAYDATNDRLIVADNGPDQQIKAFTNLSNSTGTAPYLDSTFFNGGRFGYLGGVFAGPTPGLVYVPSAGGNQRLYHPTSVTIDASGTLTIGSSFSGGTLRRYDSAGNLKWMLFGENFVQTAAVDPTTNPSADVIDVYTGRGHYKVDLTKPLEEQVTLYSYTWGSTYNASVIDTGVNRYSPYNSDSLITYIGGQKFLSLGGTQYYRFVGETAIAAVDFYSDGGSLQMWRDANADGIRQSNEVTSFGSSLWMPSTSVDDSGGLWFTSGTTMVHFIATGVDANGIPTFVKDSTNYQIPAPFSDLGELDYDVATDTMYLAGGNAEFPNYQTKNRLLARYNNWSTGNRTPEYVIELPYDLSVGVTGGGITFFLTSVNFDVAGDYIFVQTPFSALGSAEVYVYDKVHGNLVTRLFPGPEVGAKIGNTDNGCKIHAFARSNGEYLIFSEDDGYNKTVMFRWNPNEAPTTTPTVAPSVTTDNLSNGIKLQWNVQAKSGVLTGYNVYRSTAANGVFQKINASPVQYNNFTDTNITPGVTYYYKVTSINAAGEGVASQVVSRRVIAAGAQYVQSDSSTQGAWSGKYGSQGYVVIGDNSSMPAWASVVIGGKFETAGASTTSNSWDLQRPSNLSQRVSGGYYSSAGFWVDVDLADGLTHQVALYVKCGHANGVGDIFTVSDAITGKVLDVQEYRSFSTTTGTYIVFNVSGHVTININNDSYQAELEGVFIDPATTITSTQFNDSMVNLQRIDTTRSTSGWSIVSVEGFKYTGDKTRAVNTSSGNQYLTWEIPGATSFGASIVYNSSVVSNLASVASVYASTDGNNWTQISYSLSTPTTTADSLRLTTLSNTSSLPAGTKYVRFQVNAPSNSINFLRAYSNAPANLAPTAQPINVNMNGNTATLSVAASDDNGGSNLTYSWAAVDTMPGAVTFSANGTNAASTTQATFTVPGIYTIQVNVYDSGSLLASSSFAVGYSDQPYPPTAPANLTALAISAASVRLNWSDQSNNETAFAIDYSTDSTFTTGVTTTTVQVNSTSAVISGLNAQTTYYFRVRATNSYGSSANTSPASAETYESGAGIGFSATYYNNMDFTGTSITRLDPTIDFDWALGAPDPSIDVDTFSVRWIGELTIPTTGTYYFRTTSDDGVRLWVNGVQLVNSWVDRASTSDTTTGVAFTAGQRVPIVMEYYDNGQNAVAFLHWQTPGSGSFVTIPTSMVHPVGSPSNLAVTGSSPSQINLTWTDNATDESGFVLERATSANFTTGLTTFNLGANVTSYFDTSVTAGVTYYYRIRAINTLGNSTDSAVVAAQAAYPTITGTLFNDLNGDGIKQSGESGLANQTVYIDLNNNGVLDTSTSSTISYTGSPIFISDYSGSATTTTSTVNVSGLGTIADINVAVNIAHTRDGDLYVYLVSPNGTRIRLFNRTGFSSDNLGSFTGSGTGAVPVIYTLFDDSATTPIANGTPPYTANATNNLAPYQPYQALSAFNGLSANGTWTLEVVDNRSVNTGYINGWKLYITTTGDLSTTTDAGGNYTLTPPAAGTFAVRTSASGGYLNTIPSSGLQSVLTAYGAPASGVNFGLALPQTAAPTAVTLAAASDTGASSSDNLTNLNNSSGKTLSFNVTGTVAGATVYLYADGNLIGQAVANGSTTLVTTNGTTNLSDGSHSFTARQQNGSAALSNATGAATVGIDTVAPRVTGVLASSTAWAASLLTYLNANGLGTGGYQLSGSNQSRTLPWNNVNQLKINFSEDVGVIQSSLSLRGTNVASYLSSGFAYANKQAVWTLAAALGADRLLADLTDGVTDAAGNALDGEWTTGQTVSSGNGTAGGHLLFRFNSLPGDRDGNGLVLSNDVNAVRMVQFSNTLGVGNYSIFADIDGSGNILSNDVNATRMLQFTALPAALPN